MLTREQKHQMLDMRLDGATYDAIGEHFGVSKQRVQQILCGKDRKGRKGAKITCAVSKQNRLDRYAYPNIAIWMNEHDCSLTALAAKTPIKANALSRQLRGESEVTLSVARAIIDLTGMPLEMAFERKVNEDEDTDSLRRIASGL